MIGDYGRSIAAPDSVFADMKAKKNHRFVKTFI